MFTLDFWFPLDLSNWGANFQVDPATHDGRLRFLTPAVGQACPDADQPICIGLARYPEGHQKPQKGPTSADLGRSRKTCRSSATSLRGSLRGLEAHIIEMCAPPVPACKNGERGDGGEMAGNA